MNKHNKHFTSCDVKSQNTTQYESTVYDRATYTPFRME